MIDLLFISKDTANLVYNESFHYLEQELAKITNLTIWRQSGNIHNILNQIPTRRPDFILIQNDIGETRFPLIDGLANLDIPVGLFIEDVHRFVEERRRYIEENNIRYLFSIPAERFRMVYPQYIDRFRWFPHHVNTTIFKDYRMPKNIDMLLMGAFNSYYPLRMKVFYYYQNDPRFVCHGHPGYRQYSNSEKSHLMVRGNYSKKLNSAKIFFTCPSLLQYPVMKYYEALASKTLLLASTFKELEDLGFIPGQHFVPVNETDFHEKAEYYLKHEEERNYISEQGYQFVRENHSTEQRAKQLVQVIEDILASK